MTFSRKDSNPPEYLSAWTPDPNHFIPVTVLQSPFLIDFDPNLMVFNRHSWAYAVVDNLLRKSNVERGVRNAECGMTSKRLAARRSWLVVCEIRESGTAGRETPAAGSEEVVEFPRTAAIIVAGR